jgi:RimJ/RimL family protein N-acetyltransferase
MDRGPTIETDRLLLRRWRESDKEPFAALNGDPDVMEHFPSMLDREQSDRLADQADSSFDEHGYGLWAVEVKGVHPFIGFVGLHLVGEEILAGGGVEVGWRLAKPAWGHGYAPEAATAGLRFGFEQIGLGEVVSFTSVGNANSRRVMEKIGMHCNPADDFDHPRIEPGHPLRRHVLYRLKAEEWRAQAQRG